MDEPSAKQVEQWYPRLFRTALRMTGSVEDATDLTQETFCKALERWAQFDGRSQPTTWLHQILVNTVRDWMRKRKRWATESLDPWMLVPCEGPQPDAAMGQAEEHARMRQMIAELPDRLRQPLIAIMLDGYSYEEAAELQGVPLGTLASRLHEARRRLKRAMQNNERREVEDGFLAR